jgi:branched-chain amino acid aminotransferase
MELKIEDINSFKEKYKDDSELTFGTMYTDRMFSMHYSDGKWHNAKIHKLEDLKLHPAAKVLHYSQTIFEGMKAYKSPEGKALLFRPRKNFERMNKSATRMVMPTIDIDFTLDSLKKLISLEKDWIPTSQGTSLYIRPTMIAMDPNVGVKPSKTYLFYIILSPVGSYYESGYNPIKIQVVTDYVRAAKGGTGDAKTGGNYAGSLYATVRAKEKGCQQVLWLDAQEKKYVEEVGTMNIFFRFKDKVITPPLEGTILEGITRDSAIQLIKNKHNIEVSEEKITINEVMSGVKNGELLEIFGSGTAAVITPVGEVLYQGKTYTINNNKIGELTQNLFNDLTDIQYGRIKDERGWVEVAG